MSGLRDDITHALAPFGEPELRLLGAWRSTTRLPGLRELPMVHAVVAYPALRLATLRHWRDTFETTLTVGDAPVHLVAHEASKWARLLLKGHGGSLLIAGLEPVFDSSRLLSKLGEIAGSCANADTREWCEAANGPAPAANTVSAQARFDALESWLTEARCFAIGA